MFADDFVSIHHGDCLEVMRGMEADSIDAIVTDPPYGIEFVSARRKRPEERHRPVINDDAPFVEWVPDAYRVLKDGGCLVCFYRWDVQDAFVSALTDAGFTIKSQVVWHKGGGGIGDLNAAFAPEHELALFAVKGAFSFRHGRPMSVLRVPRVRPDDLVHPCEKPVALMEALLRVLTDKGDTVFDPFAGSGATLVAAQRLERRAIGCELDADYCDIIRRRLSVRQGVLL